MVIFDIRGSDITQAAPAPGSEVQTALMQS